MVTKLVRTLSVVVGWLRASLALLIELGALALLGYGVGMLSVPAALIVVGAVVILAVETQ